MKPTLTGCTSLLAALAAVHTAAAPTHTAAPTTNATPPAARLRATLRRLPLHFEDNHGQTDKTVRFVARGLDYNLFLTSKEALLVRPPAPGQSRPQVVGLHLRGANPHVTPRGVEQLPGQSHYYFGHQQAQASHFARVCYPQVYPGIDLLYYGNQSQLEYDFRVAPGADPQKIRLGFSGVKALRLDQQGGLLLQTAQGTFRQHPPVLYQSIGGKRQPVTGRYRLQGKQVGFQVARYDHRQPLVIDPVLTSLSYLGGSSSDIAWGIAVDSQGSAYLTGDTYSADFPHQNAFTSPLSGRHDVFVTKVNAAGTGIVYSTYFGGSFIDRGTAIAVDGYGAAYVTGSTSSTDFVVTSGAYRRSNSSGSSDAFVTKISPTGALVYSTYLGGNGTEEGKGIGVDAQGNAYVTGPTSSTNFPTVAALQSSKRGSTDAFVSKLNASGSALLYSTYLGGDGGENGYGIAVDAATGNAYVVGDTSSSNFPVTAGAYQTSFHGLSDAFVVKLSTAGARLYATYLGGSGGDTAYGVAVDAAGCAYITGMTLSPNFPLAQPLDNTCNCGDAFVSKLNASGSALLYSTYLGGSGSDIGYGIALDAGNNAYVTGKTTSTDFPMAHALQSTYGGGTSDGFLAVVSASGTSLVYASYVGGNSGDTCNAVAVDEATGRAYIAGETWSSDLKVVNAFQTSKKALDDAFVAMFDGLVGGDTTLPSVDILTPSTGTTVKGTVSVQATASDNIGVAEIDFFVDDVRVATTKAASASYSWDTTKLADGGHRVRADALDTAGNVAETDVSVTVSNGTTGTGTTDSTPPTISLTSPANGSVIRGTRTIQASASDNIGVTAVDFYIDNVKVGTDTTSPYSYTWYTTTAANGSHTLRVVARDAAGNTASAQSTVTVDNTPPTVSITSPANGATVKGTITVQANASDNIGMSSVRFYIDGVLKASDTLSPYTYSWNTTTVPNGGHTLLVIAVDKAGNSANVQISVTVGN